MNKERIGALIDGIYAIAMTILVLDLPLPDSSMELAESLQAIVLAVVDYGLTFLLLFGFWYNQRRINELMEDHSRLTLWLNGLVLMLVCLVPFAATLLYRIGADDSSLFKWDYAIFADFLFVGICLSVDILIHAVLWLIGRHHVHSSEALERIKIVTRSRQVVTLVVVIVIVIALVLPVPKRNTLIIIPLLLIFEDEVVKGVDWIRNRKLS